MKYTKTGLTEFNLDHIFDCGQCFRWERQPNGSYTGTAMGKIVNMRYDIDENGKTGASDENCKDSKKDADGKTGIKDTSGTLTIDNCDEKDFNEIWAPYLDLGQNYAEIKAGFTGEEIKKAAEYGGGIRILKQEFWEALISFIISQNNNIPRIKGCIDSLAANFGERIGEYDGKEYFAIPEPEVLASLSESDLSVCRLGYRAPYLIETAREVIAEGGKDAVEARLRKCESFDEAVQELRAFKGVGPKVASCVALFGLGFLDAFPIDVWMRRVMHRLYGIDEKDVQYMSRFAKENFAPYGGIAQQYLFYYIRGLDE